MRDTVLEQHPASEHGAVSVGSPMQSLPPNKGAVQARARIFLPQEQEGSQWDHCPHACHSPSTGTGVTLVPGSIIVPPAALIC